jgi:hypothetical protein
VEEVHSFLYVYIWVDIYTHTKITDFGAQKQNISLKHFIKQFILGTGGLGL